MKYRIYFLTIILAVINTQCTARSHHTATTTSAPNSHQNEKKQTASGLSYNIIRVGKGAKPKANDEVKVLFTSYTANGELLDGTLNRAPVILPISEMFLGLQEGLMLMQEGGIYELHIPAHLGYSEEGKSKKQAVRYRIELLKINP